MLEPYDGKLSRTVLRRESGSNPADLADIIFGGFAPNSNSAEVLSKALGSRTVMSGSVSRSKNDPSQSLQMIERPLMTPDELKSMPKGQFIVMKTGFYPMRVRLKLYFDWGIQFDEQYAVPEKREPDAVERISTYAQSQCLDFRIKFTGSFSICAYKWH